MEKKKINKKKLSNYQIFDEKKIFGNWIYDDKLSDKYQNALPINHVIIDNFLNIDYAEKIYEKYPTVIDEKWHKYNNPLEVKYANNDINKIPEEIKNLFYYLSTDKMINKFSKISGILDLQYDPYLHGAGLHMHPRFGRLNLHLDYEKHPITNKERRMNIILYLSKDWKNEWNGATELWDKDASKCIIKSSVKFNTAIIFQTNDISFHGLPEKILCPEGILRKSFAYYYISELSSNPNKNKLGANHEGYRTKASFIKRPSDDEIPQLTKLYNIRPNRRITDKDMEEIWPEWTPEIF
jgi:Rps23 Pro-64 3,4-dihydroxylase Tpa1-like proline 4-hydroxylase